MKKLFFISLISCVLLLEIVPNYGYLQGADLAHPNLRDAITSEIKESAKRHFETGSHIQTQLVVEIYRHNTAGLSLQDIANIYEEEYARFQKNAKSSIWIKLKNKLVPLGWLAFFITLLWNSLKKWISKGIEKVGNWIYNKFSGIRLFNNIALKNYQKSLIKRYQKVYMGQP